MRPSVRFDVFKRDDFACVYCGRRPPAVTLEVDHLIPRAEGGDDDYENLVTSCWDCNRGKGATPLDVPPPNIPDLEQQAELIREREKQLRAYNAAQQERRERREQGFNETWNYWFDLWGYVELPRYYLPWEGALRKYLDLLGVSEVKEAMDISYARFHGRLTTNAVRYFIGVCKRKVADLG